jgi:two-component system response regulator (stage 0 sporulation protein F)
MIQFFNMAVKRILIVDDQRDIRQLLRESIRVLRRDIDIIDVPSGEEAILVITRQRFDLLVTDVRLAGMSGLELVRKLRKRNPGLKVILVTGLTDSEIRQQVTEAGAEAFFFKPVDIADFQAGVVDLLGLTEGEREVPEVEAVVEKPPEVSLAGQLTKLREDLGADCIFLIDPAGIVLERSGAFPAGLDERSLVSSAVAMEAARAALARSLGNDRAEDYLVSRGKSYQLHLVPAGERRFLLALTRARVRDDPWEATAVAIAKAMAEAAAVLRIESVEELQPGVPNIEGASPIELDEELAISEVDLSQLDVALHRAGENKANTQDLDDFWDSAAEQVGVENSSESGSISYEQALRLGIAPTNESE